MDGDNIDFPALVESRARRLFGNQSCAAVQRAAWARAADFRGVASTLKVAGRRQAVRADRSGRAQPSRSWNRSSKSTKRSWNATSKATQPTDEELNQLAARAIAQGSLVPILCVLGARRAPACRRSAQQPCPLCAVPPDAHSAYRQGHAAPTARKWKSRPTRPRPLVAQVFKTPHRPVRAEADLHPRVQRHDQEGRHDFRGRRRRTQGPQDRRQLLQVQAGDTSAHRRGRPRLHRGPGQEPKNSRRAALPRTRWTLPPDGRSPRPWSAWP